jgi:hypothetical protein
LFTSFCLATGFVVIAGMIFDRLLLKEGIPKFGLLLASNLLTGIVAGLFYVQSRIREIEKQRLNEQRLAKIAEMNHHIRNALQVVAFYDILSDNARTVGTVKEAIHRIEWTLQEVLPKGWDLQENLTHSVIEDNTAANAKSV